MNKFIYFFIFCIFILTGCNLRSDKLYVFELPHSPTEADWENGLPYYISIEKGKLNHISTETKKLDDEIVHKSNKTCHHVEAVKPVTAELTSFHTKDFFFMRIKWPDPDMDNKPAVWDEGKQAWDKTKGAEDGISILWNFTDNSSYNCSSNCHLDEFEVKNSILTPFNKMKTKNEERHDFWSWWAGRNKTEKYIIPGFIDSTGIHEEKQYLTNSGKIPIMSYGYYKDGYWIVTISSPLNYFKLPSNQFVPDKSYQFQIAFFDNSYSDHSITLTMQNAVFVESKIIRDETKDFD
ncbi:hypothetical protein HY745_08185 [Candidatus Desantisbacteria bacterium]|nr:hypothetical protein [Candidatus Desantisbacteria bacterium]